MANVTQHKSIELELRAEILPNDREALVKRLDKAGVFHSDTKRMSVMCFGVIGGKKTDVRIRVTNGECEVVLKQGTSFGGHDRVEVSQEISADQFVGMVKIFARFGFKIKVGEREAVNYTFPGDVMVSLASGGNISYIELEKMSSKNDLEENKAELHQLADQLKINLLKSEEEYLAICRRLDKVDWRFHGTSEEYAKLEKLVNLHTE